MTTANRDSSRGQILVAVVLAMVALLIMVPALVQWVRQEAKLSVKDRKSTTAFNLAQAAVDRGFWKAKSSTGTIAMALAGTPIAGYEFDVTYGDLPGGTYRVKLSSAPNKSILIVGEGRDSANKETRAVSATFQNRTLYSPLLATGDVSYKKGVSIFWGPIMSQGNIRLDNTTAQWYFPQKYAKASVVGTGGNPRDTTFPLPPNTDNVEWWANYRYVPELPILDFVSLRSSAAATNTLNVYGCTNGTHYTNPATGGDALGAASWDQQASCTEPAPHFSGTGGAICTGASCHFDNSWNHPKSANPNAPVFNSLPPGGTDYIWYWDGDVTLSGSYCGYVACGNSAGLRGTLVVRGNLTIDTAGEFNYTGPVPVNAWQQHQKLTTTLNDTAGAGEYPADLGFHKSNTTFQFGADSFCFPTSPPGGTLCGFVNTVGIKGFTYVGGNLSIKNFLDFNGAVWVNGSVTAQCPGGDPSCLQSFCGVFFDDTLSVPTLNVILVRTAWQEVPASATVWQ